MSEWDRIARDDAKRARLGQYPACAECGESATSCLQRSRIRTADGTTRTTVLCADCRLVWQGKRPSERHHLAGRNNDPATAAIPANEHAILSDAQHDWPERTLRNPDGSPLLRAAGALRGWLDVLRVVLERTVGWIPDLLEFLDAALGKTLGDRWWEAADMEGIQTWLPNTNR